MRTDWFLQGAEELADSALQHEMELQAEAEGACIMCAQEVARLIRICGGTRMLNAELAAMGLHVEPIAQTALPTTSDELRN
jgi:hypothetical protein